MASYVLSRRQTKLHNALYVYFFLGLIAPVNYVTTLFTLKFLHLQNTYTGIILEFGTLGIPFLVFLYYGFYDSIPKELDEAAVIDGCTPFQLFFRVIFPLLKPATITGLVLNFLGAWNDFVTPLYLLSDNKKLGMTNSIYNFFGEHFNDWNMIFAGYRAHGHSHCDPLSLRSEVYCKRYGRSGKRLIPPIAKKDPITAVGSFFAFLFYFLRSTACARQDRSGEKITFVSSSLISPDSPNVSSICHFSFRQGSFKSVYRSSKGMAHRQRLFFHIRRSIWLPVKCCWLSVLFLIR